MVLWEQYRTPCKLKCEELQLEFLMLSEYLVLVHRQFHISHQMNIFQEETLIKKGELSPFLLRHGKRTWMQVIYYHPCSSTLVKVFSPSFRNPSCISFCDNALLLRKMYKLQVYTSSSETHITSLTYTNIWSLVWVHNLWFFFLIYFTSAQITHILGKIIRLQSNNFFFLHSSCIYFLFCNAHVFFLGYYFFFPWSMIN